MVATLYDSYIACVKGSIPPIVCGYRRSEVRMHVDMNTDIEMYFSDKSFTFKFEVCASEHHGAGCTRAACVYTFCSRVL